MISGKWRAMSIRNRLTAGSIVLAVVPLLLIASVIGGYSIDRSSKIIEGSVRDRLVANRETKKQALTAYFDGVAKMMRTLSGAEEVRASLRDGVTGLEEQRRKVDPGRARKALAAFYRDQFSVRFAAMNPGARIDAAGLVDRLPDLTVAAQYQYIVDNPNPVGKKSDLVAQEDGTRYDQAHRAIHAFATTTVEDYDLHDFFLVDASTGYVIYSYSKEVDFATSLRDGPWSGTGLADAYRRGIARAEAGALYMTDFTSYPPRYGAQALFVSTPVIERGRISGVMIAQLSSERVSALMTSGGHWRESGLGGGGENYLVGAGGMSRSEARMMQEAPERFLAEIAPRHATAAQRVLMQARRSSVGVMPMRSAGATRALAGQAGVEAYSGYTGHPVIGAYAPLEILGVRWGILSEMPINEALAPVGRLRSHIVWVSLVALLLVGVASFVFGQALSLSIYRPLSRIRSVMHAMVAGDLSARTRMTPRNELGELGAALDALLDEKVRQLESAREENEQLNASVIDIMTLVSQLADRDLTVRLPVYADVTGSVSDAINVFTESTEDAIREVDAISSRVSDSASRVLQRADTVGLLATEAFAQADSASEEIRAAASAFQEMGVQADEANREAERALEATAEALAVVDDTVVGINRSRDRIRETEKRVKRLAERSSEINSVVASIGRIAERTSVLALNASMQAVAAGEAGRGFAIIADEVKRLAENSRDATEEVAALMASIQADAADTLDAMNETIGQVVDITRLAGRAGGQMHGTRTATHALVESVKSISRATIAQKVASERLLVRATELLDASSRTLEHIQSQREEAVQLDASAHALVSMVGSFKLNR